ncbi:MAG: hypothetical protein JWM40_983 [Frankiales bacterium]|nr:hypothetical protein [Frankiales bacterium]
MPTDTARRRWETGLAIVIAAQLAVAVVTVAQGDDRSWRTRSGGTCEVRSHPHADALAADLLQLCQSAVRDVTTVWGRGWAQRADLVVAADAEELGVLVGGGDLEDVAAVTKDGQVLINAAAFRRLSDPGRRVVTTHEVTHLATGAVRGRGVPTWLIEGFADYVGYLHAGVPLQRAASELADEVRAGQVPRSLPDEAAFDGGHQPSAYEQSWLAVSLLVREHGQGQVVRLYRAVAAGTAFARALPLLLDTSVAGFTAAWRADLTARLR